MSLQLYALEGFVARLAASSHHDRFVLKGGLLMAAFDQRRPTRNVDLLALGLDNDAESVRGLVRSIAAIAMDDGLELDAAKVRANPIREGDRYSGVRVSVPARLATAHVPFHVDVNVGDPVVPPPSITDVPRLLGGDPLRVLGYPVEMVIAEKLVTAFERGGANTRWRDFADLYLLRSGPTLDPTAAVKAIHRVAAHRNVTLGPFEAVREALEGHADSKWRAWRAKQGLDTRVPEALADVLAAIQSWADDLVGVEPPSTR